VKSVVIVGGGIAGLAAAHRLAQTLPDASLTLLESDARLGGKIATDRVDGFVVEGGPDTFLAYKPRGVGLCRELGLEPRLHGTNPVIRRTYIMRGPRLYDLPEGLTGLIPSRFGPMARTALISPVGKLRLALEYSIPPRADAGDESIAAFVQRRLGRELYDRLIEPLLSGIYAGDGAHLSLAATFPQLRQAEREHGGLIRSMLAARRKASAPARAAPARAGAAGHSRSAFLTPTTGLAEIVEALEARLAGRVALRLNTPVVRVAGAPGGYRVHLASGETLPAEAVILAAPAFVTADLLAGLDPAVAAGLRAIPYVSTATVSVAYPLADIPRPLDGYGYLIPRAENRPILACTWTSTKFPHRAPEGFGLIRAFVGSAGREAVLDQDDDALVDLVRAELRRALGITASPLLQRVFRWPRAMPQYTVGHLDRLAAVEQRLTAYPGLYLAGNGYRGIGLPDCIASGEQAAAAAARLLAVASVKEPGGAAVQ
jgi:oxygen-dependent protoporphyrinogen oxidase